MGERVFYLAHRPVIGESAETAKIRIEYEASANECQTSTSLNESVETGPLLQNRLWDILIRSRFRPIILCSDIEKTFLQIRIRELQWGALRFHWVSNFDLNRIEVNRFTRLTFGLTQSLFIFEGMLKEYFTLIITYLCTQSSLKIQDQKNMPQIILKERRAHLASYTFFTRDVDQYKNTSLSQL